jgi:heme/copper-type cytochrome/quinol oxidase subunit 1
MSRRNVFLVARITGHIAWWAFVVATLFADGITWLGVEQGYYRPFIPSSDGWTAYTPLTGATVRDSPFHDFYGYSSSSSDW